MGMKRQSIYMSDQAHEEISRAALAARAASFGAFMVGMALRGIRGSNIPTRFPARQVYPPDAYCDNCVQKDTYGGVTSCDRHRSCFIAYIEFTRKLEGQ